MVALALITMIVLSCLMCVIFAMRTRNAPDEAIYQKAEKSRQKLSIDLKTYLDAEAKAMDEYESTDSEIDTNFLKNLDDIHES